MHESTSPLERTFGAAGYITLVVGTVLLAPFPYNTAAITATLFDNIGAVQRTVAGLLVAALMIGIGEPLSRRPDRQFRYWLSTT